MTTRLWSLLVMAAALAPTGGAEAKDRPFNRVIVLVDASGSYAGRQAEAVEMVGKLLAQMGETRLRRWEQGDEVVIAALDAIPEVIWRGSVRRLGEEERGRWLERFRSRRDYAACTDIAAGFRLAGRELGRSPEPTGRFVLAFTDLKHEPPLASASSCKAPGRPGPPAGFPWEALRGVSTAVFWVPVDQKLAWRRAIEDQGDEFQVELHAESDSGAVPLVAPPKAHRVLSADQRAQERGRALGLLGGLGGWLVAAATLGLLGLAALGTLAFVLSRVGRRAGRRQPERRG